MHVRLLRKTKSMFVFDHSLGTVTLISIPFTSYNAFPSLVQYSLSLKILKIGVQSNFAEYLEIEKTNQYGLPDVEGS